MRSWSLLTNSSGRGATRAAISGCYAIAAVSGRDHIGGLVGYNISVSTYSNCYAGGSVEGTGFNVGGLFGGNISGTINTCYTSSVVSGVTNVGGLIGYDSGSSYTNSFWDTTVNSGGLTGIGNISDPPDVIGQSTTNLQTRSTFTDAGWDIVGESANGTEDIWWICDGTNTPKLDWQWRILGDFVCPDGVEMFDFAYFAQHWLEPYCQVSNDCEGADLDLSDEVGMDDLLLFVANWLIGI